MDGDRRLDEVLDAYEEAFENLPVYQRSNYMKMNDVDRLARDVAFEIILGGDRFEPSDVAAHLDGISRPEMGLFKKRVEYHTVDFAPEEMRTPDFVGRMIEGWTQGVRLSDGTGIREAFSAAYNRQERGLWFRFDDGSVRRCDRAVTDAMWRGEELARMDPKPLSAAEAACIKADALISRYGSEVRRDGWYQEVSLDSFSMNPDGDRVSVMRDRDDLARSVGEHSYYMTYDGRTTPVRDLNQTMAERLILWMDNEKAMRESVSLTREDSLLHEGAVIGLPDDTVIYAPVPERGVSSPFKATAVFDTPDGRTMVSGRFVGDSPRKPELNFPLSELSDNSVSKVRQATDVILKGVLSKMAALETGRSVAKSRNVERKPKGPSIG